MPISPQALELCGEPRKPNQLVFEDLPNPSWISRPLKKWLKAAGIRKKETPINKNCIYSKYYCKFAN